MGGVPQQAGPGSDRASSPPVVPEAAGPAGPRLRIEEVGTRVGPDFGEASVSLTIAEQRFRGRARSQGSHEQWRLAAAAAVGAIQQYLRQRSHPEPSPEIQLLETALTTTSLGLEAIHATIRVSHGGQQMILLGSALVRNDRCSTAAAAALDAVDRQLSKLAPPALAGRAAQRGDSSPTSLPRPTLSVSAAPERAAAPPRLSVASAPHTRPAASLALHLSSSEVQAAVVDQAGRLLSRSRRGCSPSDAPGSLVALAVESCREAMLGLADHSRPPDALGIAISPGIQVDNGHSTASAAGAVSYQEELGAVLARELGVAVHPIREAAAVALAEARVGAAQTLSPFLFVQISPDVVAVVVRDDQLMELHDAGHMVIHGQGPRCGCGQKGCWQALAGDEALVGRVIKAVTAGAPSALAAALSRGASSLTPTLICQLAMSGDAVAREAVTQTGQYLAWGLGNLMSLFDPQAVMISAEPAAVRTALGHAAELALKASPRSQSFSRCVFLRPELGPTAPLLGAAAWAAMRNGQVQEQTAAKWGLE